MSRFERRPVRLDHITLETVAGEQVTVADVLRRTCTDGFLVLHEGRIVAEEYFNGMTPATRHLLMSVSKSIIGTLAGIVIGRGVLSADDLVSDVVTELRGTSFEQATVRHLLDMRTGTRFSEDYDDPQSDVCRSERIADWGPLLPGEESVRALRVRSQPRQRPGPRRRLRVPLDPHGRARLGAGPGRGREPA